MKLIDQHTKEIMEECKIRARDAGLRFDDESLEYVVTNQDLLELSPKHMIPTLYDYWVHDVNVILEKEKYKLYPYNPYETVINTRPAVSFYNDNNPDWLNVMIFYHVIAHIDFYQNNIFFKHTWSDDFIGRARADKRLIAKLRSQHGRWVDYVIEFARSIDNISGYYRELSELNISKKSIFSKRVDYYFDVFLQDIAKAPHYEYLKSIKNYNEAMTKSPELGESIFFTDVKTFYPEFESLFQKFLEKGKKKPKDLLEFLLESSTHLNKDENKWMKSVIHVVRDTSLYFEPQRRDQIFNEGWASFWHEKLFINDDRIKGHEVDFARVHAKVTAISRIGLNPYAIGMRLLSYIEELSDKGKISYDYQKTYDLEERKKYNKKTGKGVDFLLKLREDYCDFTLINSFVDQDFVNKYKLFTVEKRMNKDRQTWEYTVKSKKANDYKQMLLGTLWHPPNIIIDQNKTDNKVLYLYHKDEEKPLMESLIPNTMLGIEYLWGGEVKLETTDMFYEIKDQDKKPELVKTRVLYTMKDRKLIKNEL